MVDHPDEMMVIYSNESVVVNSILNDNLSNSHVIETVDATNEDQVLEKSNILSSEISSNEITCQAHEVKPEAISFDISSSSNACDTARVLSPDCQPVILLNNVDIDNHNEQKKEMSQPCQSSNNHSSQNNCLSNSHLSETLDETIENKKLLNNYEISEISSNKINELNENTEVKPETVNISNSSTSNAGDSAEVLPSKYQPNSLLYNVDIDDHDEQDEEISPHCQLNDTNSNSNKVSVVDGQHTWRDRNQSFSSSDCGVQEDIILLECVNTSPLPHPPRHIRTKGELTIDDLPPVEYLSISAEDRVELVLLGNVSSVIDKIIVIEALPNSPPLDMDSVLFFKDRRVFGQIFETFGRVKKPYYIVRFNCKEDIAAHDIVKGISVYYAANETAYSKFVLSKDIELASKGSDASWKDNNEPPPSQLDFSDDEQEREFRRSLKKKDTAGTDANPSSKDNESSNSESYQRKRYRSAKTSKQRKYPVPGQNQSIDLTVHSIQKTNETNPIRSNQQTGNWFSNPNYQQPPPPATTPAYTAAPPPLIPPFLYNPSQYPPPPPPPVPFPDLSRPPPPLFNQGTFNHGVGQYSAPSSNIPCFVQNTSASIMTNHIRPPQFPTSQSQSYSDISQTTTTPNWGYFPPT